MIGMPSRSPPAGQSTASTSGSSGCRLQTAYSIKGRFVKGKHGSYKAVGTDSSPICQPTTPKRFTIAYVPGES
jgi:hypothetical protein